MLLPRRTAIHSRLLELDATRRIYEASLGKRAPTGLSRLPAPVQGILRENTGLVAPEPANWTATVPQRRSETGTVLQ